MLKRTAALCVVSALVILAFAPASAFASTSVKRSSNSNTTWTTTLTYVPSSTKDVVQKLVASEVSSAQCYRSIHMAIWANGGFPYTPTWSTGCVKQYVKSQTFSWSPNVAVSHGWNEVQVTYYASIWSWIMPESCIHTWYNL
jgi:hypothetical protein